MNKYSRKIINFLDNNIIDNIPNNINTNHELIQKIINIAKDIVKQQNEINYNMQITKINLIHNNNYPLLYQLLKDEHSDFKSFLNWYNLKQNTINFNNYKDKPEFKLIFYPEKEREHLHHILYSNGFISIDVCHYFEVNKITRIFIDNKKFILNLYLTNDDISKKDYYLDKIIKVILFMYELNDKLINKNQKQIKINVLLSHQRKELSEISDYLSPINVNSGSAIRGDIVTVWRDEEIEKVLIHEIQHYLYCDFNIGTKDSEYVTEIVNKYFKVDGIDAVNESFNETMAHIINMCYQSCKLNMDLKEIYNYEIKFLLFQCAKIFNFFGANKMTDKIVFKQTTNVLSYYVLKTYLLYNINDTINLINKFELRCVDINIKIFGDYLDEILRKTKLDIYVDKIIENLDKLDDCYVKRTLRMTVIN